MTRVKGWAGGPSEARQPFADAWERVKHLHPQAVQNITHGYARNTVTLDSALTEGLTNIEKLVLADHGNACFGGEVHGTTVTIYTD